MQKEGGSHARMHAPIIHQRFQATSLFMHLLEMLCASSLACAQDFSRNITCIRARTEKMSLTVSLETVSIVHVWRNSSYYEMKSWFSADSNRTQEESSDGMMKQWWAKQTDIKSYVATDSPKL